MIVEAISDFLNKYLSWAPDETQLFIAVMVLALVGVFSWRIFKLHIVWIIFLLLILVPVMPLIIFYVEMGMDWMGRVF